MGKVNRTLVINIKATPHEKAAWSAIAKAKGLTLSGYIRSLVYADTAKR